MAWTSARAASSIVMNDTVTPRPVPDNSDHQVQHASGLVGPKSLALQVRRVDRDVISMTADRESAKRRSSSIDAGESSRAAVGL
jgi:hypothetical protein